MGKRPSFGRSKSERGLDQFDTPPIALEPLFAHESLLAGVKVICEPFAGKGNLVMAMRARGIAVHASDIQDRGCPDSTVLDFLEMTQRPEGCDVLLSNPPFRPALKIIEHAFKLGFRLVILLLKTQFLNGEKRYARLYARGHLRRVYPFAERIQDMHDARHVAAGGNLTDQNQDHGWFVFDRDYCGCAETIQISIKNPTAHMPWQTATRCTQCNKPYRPRRMSSKFCSDTCRQRAHYRKQISVRLSVRTEPTSSTEEFRYVLHDDVPKFAAEGWEAIACTRWHTPR